MEERSVNEGIHTDNETNTKLKEDSKVIMYQNANIKLPVSFSTLSKIAIFKCGSVGAFGRRLGVSRSRASQILNGIDIPIKPDSIQKIADVLSINIVLLTQLFSQQKEDKNE